MSELLRLSSLTVGFTGAAQPVLRDLELDLAESEAVALVGASGAGKTLLARAALGLLPPDAWQQGRVMWRGVEVRLRPGGWAALRGSGLTWLPQEPLSGLNPLLTVGVQVTEALMQHQGLGPAAARRRAADLLAELQLPAPAELLDAWPHELSGGMRQRVLLAAALACGPALLIADEPTSSLDTTVQRDLLAMLDRARRARGMALLFITHDRDLVPLVADRCVEVSDGRLVEMVGSAHRPQPARPVATMRGPAQQPMAAAAPPALSARAVVVRHGNPESPPAVAGVDLDLWAGRAVGLVGESAAGKSSLARALAGHLRPWSGVVTVAGAGNATRGTAGAGHGAAARAARRRVQMLFQDAGASLNPRQRVGAALAEAAGDAPPGTVERLLGEVGLDGGLASRYPHALSGGQRQRVALARCLAADPAVLIADEPTSALDSEARGQVLDLLGRVMAGRGLAVLLVTHDLDTALSFCDELLVMHGGLIVERAPADRAGFLRHPHARRLLACRPAALAREPDWRNVLPAAVTSGATMSTGCPSAGACPLQNASCFKELPPLVEVAPGHWLRCPPARELPPPQFIDTL
jgi:ABC-type glutathione transport system ATPase component